VTGKTGQKKVLEHGDAAVLGAPRIDDEEVDRSEGDRPRAETTLQHRRLDTVLPRRSPKRGRGWLVRRVLVLADLSGLVLAFLAAEALSRFWASTTAVDPVDQTAEILLFVGSLPGWILVAHLYHLYDRDEERTDHGTSDDLVGTFHLVTLGSWLFLAASWATQLAHPSFPKLLLFWCIAIALVPAARAFGRALCRRSEIYVQNAIIVGAGEIGQLVARKLLQHPEYGVQVLGFLDSEPRERHDDLEDLIVLGQPEDLPRLVHELDVDRVIFAFSSDSHDETLNLIRRMTDLAVQVDIVPRLFEVVGPGLTIHTVEGLPLVGLPPIRLSRTARLIKRTMDVVVASATLAVLAPTLAVIAVLIKLDSPGPIVFRQVRMGLGSRRFQIFKFRTMFADAEDRKPTLEHLNRHARAGGDPRMFKVANDPRVTRVGRFLRHHSLDELPQLLNVIRGEMSLVGPRPLILDEDRYVDGWARKRLDLRPGITGLWQVLGRNNIPFEEMVKLDYLYVTTWSLANDFKLLVRTLPLVLRGDDNRY